MTSSIFKTTRNLIENFLSQRSFGAHVTTMLLTNFGVMFLALLTGIFSARLLGPAGRGQLAQIQLWAMFIAGYGQLGIPDALIYYTSRDPENSGQWITSAWTILLPLSLAWIILAYQLLPIILHNQPSLMISGAQVFFLLVPIAYFTQASQSFLGRKQFNAWALVRINRPLLYLALLMLLLWAGIRSALVVAVLFLVIAAFSPILVSYLMYCLRIRLALPNARKMRQLLTYGLQSMAGSTPEYLNNRLDQMLIAVFLPGEALGLYVIAVSWSLLTTGIFRFLGMTIFPYVAGLKERQAQHILLARSLRISAIIIVALMTVMIAVTPLAFSILFPEEFRPAVPVAIVLVAAASIINFKLVLSNGVRGLGMPEITAYTELLSLVVNVILLALLLPLYGIMGAAVASAIAYTCSGMLMFSLTAHRLQIPWNTLLIPTRSDIQFLGRLLRERGHST